MNQEHSRGGPLPMFRVMPEPDARCAGENYPPYISTSVEFGFHCVKTMNFIVVFVFLFYFKF